MLRQVRTENGWVRGIEAADPRITAFKGIPFAAPPVGRNRWRAPKPCENWAGVRDCSRFAPIRHTRKVVRQSPMLTPMITGTTAQNRMPTELAMDFRIPTTAEEL